MTDIVEQLRKERAAMHDALVAERARLEKEIEDNERLRGIILWALGEGDDFPDSPPTVTGSPKYWWRTELRRRFDAGTANQPDGATEGNR